LSAAFALAAVLAALLLTASGALAASSAGTAAAPRTSPMAFGFDDDPLFFDATGATRDVWLSRASALGSSVVRVPVYWAFVAPSRRSSHFKATNPADRQYSWGQIDSAVRAASAHGQRVLLMVREAPKWAETNPPANFAYNGAWWPNARMFGQFARAVALRYSGKFPDPLRKGKKLPAVRDLQAWNEPNLPSYISPQWGRSSSGQIVALSPGIYRDLLNAFYAGVKAVAPQDTVLAAATAPYGDPPATAGQRMHPVTFLQALFCLSTRLKPTSCPDPPHLDAVDHHPYSLSPNVTAHDPNDISVADLGKITRIVRAAAHYHHVVPAGPKPLWVSELDWSDVKPLNLALQARFLEEGFYDVWAQGAATVMWFQLRDPPGLQNSFAGAGLFQSTGQAKPASAAYRFPFVAMPLRHTNRQFAVWGRAPAGGTVAVQELRHGTWKTILRLRTMSGNFFYSRRRLNWHLTLRAVVGSQISPVWTTSGSY
jgi:hypothetical protein